MKPPGRPEGHATVVTWGLRVLMGYLEKRGLDTASIRSRAGLDGVDLSQPERRLPASVARRAWTLAAEATGDEALGIRVAEARTPAAGDVLEYAFRASPTLGDALGQVVRYARVMHDRSALHLEPGIQGVRLAGTVTPGHVVSRHQTEFFFATWLRLARDAGVPGLAPLDASFSHPPPARLDEHQAFFRCPVRFDQPVDGLLMSRADLGRPMRGADPALAAILRRPLDELLVSLPATPTVSGRVRGLVEGDLASGSVSIERVAGQLAMSVRSLSRRLTEEGTTFRGLVDSVRHELAVARLRDPEVNLAEIAFLLGYSESSAFHRAFKRRTGVTPLEFRRKALG